MSDTLDDISVNETWQDVYVLSAITPTSKLIIQNKSSGYVLIAEGTQPLATSEKGYELAPHATAIVDGNPTNVWVRTCDNTGSIHVEAA